MLLNLRHLESITSKQSVYGNPLAHTKFFIQKLTLRQKQGLRVKKGLPILKIIGDMG